MIVVVDYRLGNLKAVLNMLKRLGIEAAISRDPDNIDAASGLILPGVGAFDAGMQNLKELGLVSVLEKKALRERVPVLGICLGMQLMTRGSEEGNAPGLGWIPADTVRFDFPDPGPKPRIPHMGWNHVSPKGHCPLFRHTGDPPRFYFAHSYHVVCDEPANIAGTTDYGAVFTSCFLRDNILGVQFHPEKSHAFGMKLFKNFAETLC